MSLTPSLAMSNALAAQLATYLPLGGGTLTGPLVLAAGDPLTWSGRSKISSAADGYLSLTDNAGTSFNGLRFGGTGSSFPMWKRNATALNARLADDSADAAITAAAGTFSGAVLLPNGTVGAPSWAWASDADGTGTGAFRPSASQIAFACNGTTVLTVSGASVTTGGSIPLLANGGSYFGCSSRSVIESPSDGVFRMSNFAQTDFSRLQFGGTSSSFPAWKRSGAALHARLADDSAFAAISRLSVTLGSTQILTGTGNPDGSVTAPVGSIFLRTDGGAGTTLFVKESGAGSSGWVGK